MLNSFKDFASNEPLCGILIINLGKNSVCACYCKQIKTQIKSNQESNKNIKYVLTN